MAQQRTPQQRIAGAVFLVVGLGAVIYIVNLYIGGGTTATAVILSFLALVVYTLLAALVGKAAEKKGRSNTAWFLIALFLGLVIPAIIVAVMAPLTPENQPTGPSTDTPVTETKKCPMCAEWVKAEARKCKHCGSALSEEA